MTSSGADHDSTRRFSERVDNYVRYRPGYPDGVLDILRDETGLTSASVIADVGSGTGISSALFLRNGNTVYGVEPNAEMRHAAEELLTRDPAQRARFHSVIGTAESTTLPDGSVDHVVAGQAFHWFDRDRACVEFARIIRPGGWLVLMWNSRRLDSTPFLRAYESLLQRFGTDYREIRHTNIDAEALRPMFAGGEFTTRVLPNEQRFDLDGVRGRLLSSSYTPTPGDSRYEPMLRELERIFEANAEDGEIAFEYDVELYFGHPAAG
jgi:SAM-dependent methyltransferase